MQSYVIELIAHCLATQGHGGAGQALIMHTVQCQIPLASGLQKIVEKGLKGSQKVHHAANVFPVPQATTQPVRTGPPKSKQQQKKCRVCGELMVLTPALPTQKKWFASHNAAKGCK